MLTLIANTGIQTHCLSFGINPNDRYCMYFHEWFDADTSQWKLEIVQKVEIDNCPVFYRKNELYNKGYLVSEEEMANLTMEQLRADDIIPLKIGEEMQEGVEGEIYKLTFADKSFCLDKYLNVWLPLPYLFKRNRRLYRMEAYNWSRMKLSPLQGAGKYCAALAFDTRTSEGYDPHLETPVFPDSFSKEMDASVCTNESVLLNFCSPASDNSHAAEYLMKLVHPNIRTLNELRGNNVKRMSYLASYILLVSYIAQNGLFPTVRLYKDQGVERKNIDMIVDIGNSKTTALLIEDNHNFNQYKKLKLTDYSKLITTNPKGEVKLNRHADAFDMRLVFRKVQFGNIGKTDSLQFVYPSLVCLGDEANELIQQSDIFDNCERLSTCSSPKRYLWDMRPNKEEWQFATMSGASESDHVLYVNGITNHLSSEGRLDLTGNSGMTHHYSRCSLMTFAFLEMLVQARAFVNSDSYRDERGDIEKPRVLNRLIVTCPTAMSAVERENLLRCAKEAVLLLDNFGAQQPCPTPSIDVVPQTLSSEDAGMWYYDEATCAQLVYMYGEVGHKYKGNCKEFFQLYGKKAAAGQQPELTVASLDIGAGTSDLMISRFTYNTDTITRITPEPTFYDSFYSAGDDLLKGLINIVLQSERNPFFIKMKKLGMRDCRQRMKNFFGKDYNGQSADDRILRRDFNLQYTYPFFCHFLELTKSHHENCMVHFDDVFKNGGPNEIVLERVSRKFGFDVRMLEWEFDYEYINNEIKKLMEPLIKTIATIMFAKASDIIILSGRPSSLPAIRELFLKYYPASPDRIILLNDYYVGDWFPFCENTGYIRDAKTIVSVGAAIAHYASEIPQLGNFELDTTKLKEGFKPTNHFILAPTPAPHPIITPDKPQGDVTVMSLPMNLDVRQIDMESYPKRTLYMIDYNRQKIAARVRLTAKQAGLTLQEGMLNQRVEEEIDKLRPRMPFFITLERDSENPENIAISQLLDREGNELQDSNVEVHIQSLGNSQVYWLDTGEFDIQ